ncbi:MAG: bifunctional demethylmenaquinone methyltransferase/2-methoxy-6-polyprenyl-1,4-benzoquinol methylase UbiE [Leptolyngbya sp. PLA3]|nr:MAG: bifunctional demethylmenaquinone methyltransferase/2-methoxy-6-polyprenyl-1,4-benzoquinol methylase UbiE [Cyanobacteria bacterium CYA]MCE7968666.1 bifunctional demethylmenaquinone methyltransferase/2-methoxy-6-polyprenyl-1,4-benzoquinol methylase UbiE [Leptolyngbya sp. PL-A3]
MNASTKPTTEEPAWTPQTLRDPHAEADKPERVRAMFSAIARTYDLNNRLHSLWQDQRWRRVAVRTAGVNPGDVVADIACGTGDLTEAFARTPAGKVMGLDFTRAMLDLAEHKLQTRRVPGRERVSYHEADAQALPLDDQSVDVVSIAFGIRNVMDPGRALREFARVLRPGGRVVVLEFDQPPLAPVRWFNNFYSGWVMPRTATLISRDRSGAYRYLPRSVGTFMSRDDFCGLLRQCGFAQVQSRGLSMGIVRLYQGLRQDGDGAYRGCAAGDCACRARA